MKIACGNSEECRIRYRTMRMLAGSYSCRKPPIPVIDAPPANRIKVIQDKNTKPISVIIEDKGSTKNSTRVYTLNRATCIAQSEYFKCALRSRDDPSCTWVENRSNTFRFSELPQLDLVMKVLETGRIVVSPTTFSEFYETADYFQMLEVMAIICRRIALRSFIDQVYDVDKFIAQLVEWTEKWQHRVEVQAAFFRVIFQIEIYAALKNSKSLKGCALRGSWEFAFRRRYSRALS
ncbi:hypothetical protein TWF718_003382 [Orbilia javanica]|uniref:BTB domain-containing protein n=1 Tax=Orbilia javanica TaxID=47235 RepID=A0AAN8RJ06_9PEZI